MKRLLPVLAVLSFFSISVVAREAKVLKKARPIKDIYIVALDDSLKGHVAQIARELAEKHNGRVISVWEHAIRGFSIGMAPDQALQMSLDPRVVSVEEDETGQLEATGCTIGCAPASQTRSGCAGAQVPWQLDRVDALPGSSSKYDGRYNYCLQVGNSVDAYVIDSGINPHSEFRDEDGIDRLRPGFDTLGGSTTDDVGHGTGVASMIGGLTSGIAKGVKLIPVKIHTGSASELITAINWVIVNHGNRPAVANISLNYSGSTQIDNAANALVADRIVVTASAGNGNTNGCNTSPARASGVITVGSTTKGDRRASDSNYGTCVDIWAPGEAVGGATYNNYCCLNCSPGLNGTSMAAPLVAGAAAIVWADTYYDGWTPAMVRNKLVEKSEKGIIIGIPHDGTPNRLLNTNGIVQSECSWGMCFALCSDPRCTGIPPCPGATF